MSGIVAVIDLEGGPVDRDLLARMTASMTNRAPDAQACWTDASVGLGHALLRTTFEAEAERQPCSVDGVWIAADARVDARGDLLRELAGRGPTDLASRPDAELILHAYHAWGEACVDHLLGDFAFALWDAPRRQFFCARDHFGVKPLFYARVGSQLIVSNALTCVRLHPHVSNRVNDAAIADFLVLGYNRDSSATSFADIRRLPPAHVLTCSAGGVQTRRYWTLPIDRRIRYRRKPEYVEHFRELLGAAVADRLRTTRASVFMSGGMDSTSIAAAAMYDARARVCDLHAVTVVYDRLVPDTERTYAKLAAESLGMPIHFVAADDYRLYDHWDDPSYCGPEPLDDAIPALRWDVHRLAAAHGRVALRGIGADPLFGYHTDVVGLLKSGRFWRIGADIAASLLLYRRRPPIGIRTTVRALLRRPIKDFWIPPWFNAALAERLGLAERYRDEESRRVERPHPDRASAQRKLLAPVWTRSFESFDPSNSGMPLEYAYPFLDLRVVNYILAIPPLPWSQNKELLRTPIHAVLPDGIRRRPKTPLAGKPMVEHWRDPATRARIRSFPLSLTAKYLEPGVFEAALSSENERPVRLRPLSLEYWLRWARVSLT